jgi:ABC-type nitrate/sulfonate/bicarbonate transport system permease component
MVKRVKNFLLGSSLFLAILIVWQILSAAEIISPWLIPAPSKIFPVFFELIKNGSLLKLLLASLINIFPAFVMAAAAALILGVLIGINSTFRKIFNPFISAVYLVPSLAWLPLIILFLGFSRQAVWAVIFISAFIRIIYNIIGGVRGVNINWLLAARNLELDKFAIVTKVVIPAALPQILSGLRIGFGSAWRSLIGAEMLVITAGGLGKYIWMSQWNFKFDQVFSGIIVIALVGIAAEQFIFRKIEKATLAKWGMMQ